MTEHYYGSWKIGEPVTDELKKSILECVRMNLKLEANGCFNCFAIMNDGDGVIMCLCRLWIRYRKTLELLDENLKEAATTCPAPESFMEIGKYVFDELKKEMVDGD